MLSSVYRFAPARESWSRVRTFGFVKSPRTTLHLCADYYECPMYPFSSLVRLFRLQDSSPYWQARVRGSDRPAVVQAK